jgi:Flp pilus assembly CpaF family ATPase
MATPMTSNLANAPFLDRAREVDFAEAARERRFRFDGERLSGRIEPLRIRRTFWCLRKPAVAMLRFAGGRIIDASDPPTAVAAYTSLTIMTRARHCGNVIAGALSAKREATTA